MRLDHFPILTKINIEPTSRTGEKMSLLPKLIWKDEEKDNYQRKINESIRNIAGVNHINLNDINQIIVKSASKLIDHKKPFEPKNKWYNKNCNNARMKSFKLLKVYRTTRNLEDKRRYIVAQKEYKTVCSTNKSVYYNTIANKLNNIKNSKEWWKMAKEIRNQCNLVGSNITPDAFKSYYENLLNKSQETTLIHYAPPYKNDMDLDRHFTMSELRKMLVKVKRNKAPGEDRIPYEFFINGTEEFNSLLLRIYNTIYSSGEIDPVFTKTIIYPIHKKGDLNEPSNYRGISFMNCVAKLFMGLINERLYNWVENYQILTEYQAGFRKNYSTVDNKGSGAPTKTPFDLWTRLISSNSTTNIETTATTLLQTGASPQSTSFEDFNGTAAFNSSTFSMLSTNHSSILLQPSIITYPSIIYLSPTSD
ncbi:uncharacterized protein LOC131997976 [Stomoxys calcitrans]|uniref:uncharacterized protein LOC131997976 n=1 Tax=Stomoxys calcitrans TaxID=35570 RepID=UPI0027E363B3|nr:uncharacterized protein LOC131997976 [Stomoxys calcitrans]